MAAKWRPQLVVAALTILRAYHVAKRPNQKLEPLGSFNDWSAWPRSALVWLGEPDPCITMNATRQTDPDLKKLAALLATWCDLFPSACTVKRALQEARAFTMNDEPLMQKRAALLEAMEDIAGDRNEINQRKLGNWLGARANRVVNGLRFKTMVRRSTRHCAGGKGRMNLGELGEFLYFIPGKFAARNYRG